MPKLRFRADSQIQPTITTTTTTEALAEPTIETTVTTPTTIQLLSVTVPPTPPTSWGNTESNVNGWVCALAPFPIGTGAGCYYSLYGVYTNSNPSSPNNGQTYNLPCIPYFQGGSCFEFKSQGSGSPACESFCLQS